MAKLESWQIEEICDRLGIPQAGRQRVERIRDSEPSRRVGSNGRNVCVRYPSQKMGVTIQAESHTVELPYVYQLEHDETVLEYYDQPESIKLSYKAAGGRNLGIIHTPDFFVIRHDYVGYTECKTEEELERLRKASPHRYMRTDDGEWRCPPGEVAAAEVGLSYRVWSDKEINWALQANMEFLEDYIREDCPEVENDQLEKIKGLLETNKVMTIHELVTTDEIDADSVYKLIVDDQIYCDLENDRVADSSYTYVYINKAYAIAYGKLNQSEIKDSLYTLSSIRYEPGEYVIWDQVKWRIANVGASQIMLSNADGKTVPVSLSDFQAMVSNNLISGVERGSNDALDRKRLEIISSADEQALDVATQRQNVIRPILDGEISINEITGYSVRTVFRWISMFREAEREYGQGYLGLIPKNNNKGNYINKLPETAEVLMEKVICEEYETTKQKTVKAAYGALKILCDKQGVDCPSEKTFRERVNIRSKSDQARKRKGKRAASNFEEFFWRLDMTTPKHGGRPFEIGHIDHTELDIELISQETGVNLGRPWLTIMVDAFTRRILSFYLTFDPPSYKSCMMVMRECVRRNGRLPKTIVVDNGKEFASTAFETLIASYDLTKKQRPPAKGRFGSVCERMFGTTNTELIYSLAGNTQIMKDVRIATKSVNPKNLALWNIASLTGLLGDFFYEEYDLTEHPALHDSPRDTYFKRSEVAGERRHMDIPYTEDFRIRTLPSTRKGTALVRVRTGIQLNYIRYWHDSFRDAGIDGTNVPVKYDPMDAAFVYAYVKKRWVQCISDYYAVFKNRTWKEVEAATAEVRKKHQLTRKSKDISTYKIAAFLKKAEECEAALEEKKRDAEYYRLESTKPDLKLVKNEALEKEAINEEDMSDSLNSKEVKIMEDF